MSDHAPAVTGEVHLPKFDVPTSWIGAAAAIGVVGIGATLGAGGERATLSYLLGFSYWFTIAIGALFMLLAFNATAAVWVTGFRRMIEILATGVAVFIPLFAVIYMKLPDIYPWARPGFGPVEPSIEFGFKKMWLDPTFFGARAMGYLAAFTAVSFIMLSWSRSLDESKNPATHTKMVRLGSMGLPVMGLFMSGAGFDWLMSLDPNWGSTIFGAYIVTGGFMGAMALVNILSHKMRYGVLKQATSTSQYHNLGKMLFAVICFWAYVAFSQFMLMWIANLPEEITWYLARMDDYWMPVFWMLVFGHFLAPFFLLLRKAVKMNSAVMPWIAGLIMFNHFVDLSWIIIPSMKGAHYAWTDFAAVIGVGGIFLAFVMFQFRGKQVAPKGDPGFIAQAA